MLSKHRLQRFQMIKDEDLVINIASLKRKSGISFTRMLYEELKKIKDLKNRGELFLIFKKSIFPFKLTIRIRKN